MIRLLYCEVQKDERKTREEKIMSRKINEKQLKITAGKTGAAKATGAAETTGYECCVRCHRQLDIPVERAIGRRPFYIEGAGQLCSDCYHEIYR